MHSFFVSSASVSGDTILIREAREEHHLRDVVRIGVGEEVVVFDGSGRGFRCVVKSLRPQVLLSVKEKIAAAAADEVRLTVACAIPKQSKMDDIIDKLAQLGVTRVIPLVSERVVVRLTGERAGARLKRWEKIAIAAAKQSRQQRLLRIDPVSRMERVLAELGREAFDVRLIPTLAAGHARPLRDVCLSVKARNICILIGPEGDFTEAEVAAAEAARFVPVSLGEAVLRVDTAAVATAGFIKLIFQGMSP